MQPPPLPNKDAENLRTLAICHYVVSGLSLFGLGFLVLHYSIMRMFFGNSKLWEKAKEPPPFNPAEFFHLFQWFYLIFGVMIVVGGVLTLISGRFIHRRTNRTFSIVIAGLNCLHFPFGILLGIFTIIVLTKDSVIRLYAQPETKALTDSA
jgi:membrane protein YqaA with SNARE-associated domain